MKKVLSVLLAAAMVMGMSVSAFAADRDWTWTGPKGETPYSAGDVVIDNNVRVDVDDDNYDEEGYYYLEEITALNPGDVLYFPLYVPHVHTYECCKLQGHVENKWTGTDEHCDFSDCTTSHEAYFGKIDKDWALKTKTDKYVDSVAFACINPANGKFTTDSTKMGNGSQKFIKVVLVEDIDTTADVEVDFEIYMKDKEDKSESNTVAFDGAIMSNEKILKVYADDAEEVFEVYGRWIVSVKNTAKNVIFDFDDDVYYTNTVVKGEKFVLNLSTAYDKAVDALFDYDADLSFYNFKGTQDSFTKKGELFIPAAEETFIYEVVDGKLVEIEAEYVIDEDIYGMDIEDGWKIETKELGYYVVSDTEAVIEAEAEVEAPVEADKANPETGAADFVGAAVAMAVVSVAAAGALALKK